MIDHAGSERSHPKNETLLKVNDIIMLPIKRTSVLHCMCTSCNSVTAVSPPPEKRWTAECSVPVDVRARTSKKERVDCDVTLLSWLPQRGGGVAPQAIYGPSFHAASLTLSESWQGYMVLDVVRGVGNRFPRDERRAETSL